MLFFSKLILFFLRKYYRQNLVAHKNAQIGKNVKFGDIHYFEINSQAEKIQIDNNVKFYPQVNLTVGKSATLMIGQNTTINKYTSIVALGHVSIGKECLIGENVKIYDNNHRIDQIDGLQVPNHKEFSVDSVVIGNNVWIASNATILKGVRIGNNTVIGTGCIVYQDVPENSVLVNKQNLVLKE